MCCEMWKKLESIEKHNPHDVKMWSCYLDISQRISCKKQPYSIPQRTSCLGQQSTESDSDRQPGHQTVTQEANRKRPRSSTTQSAPTTSTTSGISQKRKREGTDNNPVERTSAQELDDEVSILIGSNKTTCAETPEGKRPEWGDSHLVTRWELNGMFSEKML